MHLKWVPLACNRSLNLCREYSKTFTLQKFHFVFHSRLTVNMFILLNQIGACCVYVVFVSRTFKAIVDDSMEKPIAIELYMLTFLCLFVLMLSIRNLKFIARFSLLANVITLITFSVIGYYMFQNLPNISEPVPFAAIVGYPLSVGTILFSMSAVGVVSTYL